MKISSRNETRILWAAAAGVWLILCGQLLYANFATLGLRLGDTDNAMRLVEVRRYLAGAGWFDMLLLRVSPPDGLLSHWSRLIDAGMAGLFGFFSLFVSAPMAETLMRAVWPLLWIGPLMAGVILIAWRLGGKTAAFVVVAFSFLATPGHMQYLPGRIDHHNVQIALAVLSIAAAVWFGKSRFAAVAAGFLVAAMAAIGLENIPVTLATGLIIALYFILNKDVGADLVRFGLSMAVFTGLAFLISVPPARWTTTVCDAIAINFAVPMIIAGLGLALVGRVAGNDATPLRKTGLIFAVGLVASIVFYLLDPACIRGPFAHIDMAIKPIWLDHVKEAVSIFETVADRGISMASILSFPVPGILLGVYLWFASGVKNKFAIIANLTVLVMSTGLTVLVVRSYSYAIWFAIPIVATFVAHIFKKFEIKNLALRAGLVLATSPVFAILIFILVVNVTGLSDFNKDSKPRTDACLETASFKTLAKLPAGTVAAAINLGPAILAHSSHKVLAAPYHRLSSGIIDSYGIFTSVPDTSVKIITRRKVDYVVFCKGNRPGGAAAKFGDDALWNRLKEGEAPEWLELVEMSKADAFQIYRVRR